MIKKITEIIKAINVHPLAGRHRMKAYSKFISWQLRQLLFPGIKKVKFAGDTYLLANKGMAGATGNIYCGLHEFSDMGFLLHFLREEDIFIDAGANIGSYTVLASGVAHASTICFEPAQDTFQRLTDNINVNGLADKVEPYHAALGSVKGKMKFTSGLDTVNHALSEHEDASVPFTETDVVTIDDIVNGRTNTRLIKIDTEGFETEVIAGMPQLLNNEELKAVIIEINGSGGRYGFDENRIREKLSAHGFQPCSYDPFERKLELLTSLSFLNTIYIRDKDFVEDRIASAKKINIFSESF